MYVRAGVIGFLDNNYIEGTIVEVVTNTSIAIHPAKTGISGTFSNWSIVHQPFTGATGPGYIVYSDTPHQPFLAPGPFTFLTGNTGAYQDGQFVRVVSQSNSNSFVEGYINVTANESIQVFETSRGGSYAADWVFTVSGPAGASGASGSEGLAGAQGPQGFEGERGFPGGITLRYIHTSDTDSSDPGTARLKLNNTDASLATKLYIDDIDVISSAISGPSAPDAQAFLRTLDDSTSTVKGHFYIYDVQNSTIFTLFEITGVTEQTGYFEVDCSFISGYPQSSYFFGMGGYFDDERLVNITFARTGDAGDTGATGPTGPTGPEGTFPTDPTVNVLTIDDGTKEKFQTKVDATGTVEHNCSSGFIFYHTSPDANWTVNLTNLNLSSGYATAVTLVIAQGTPAYYPSALQIGGAAQTINWQGNTTPTPTAGRTDVATFSILNNGGTYVVLGQLTGF
jgi:hypothetical protein